MSSQECSYVYPSEQVMHIRVYISSQIWSFVRLILGSLHINETGTSILPVREYFVSGMPYAKMFLQESCTLYSGFGLAAANFCDRYVTHKNFFLHRSCLQVSFTSHPWLECCSNDIELVRRYPEASTYHLHPSLPF